MAELQEKGVDVNVLFPRESPAFPGPRNIHLFDIELDNVRGCEGQTFTVSFLWS